MPPELSSKKPIDAMSSSPGEASHGVRAHDADVPAKRDMRRREARDRVAALNRKLPPDYKLDREEAKSR